MAAKAVPRTPLAALVRRYRGGIALALGLVILEHVAWIVEPAVFGAVIDALIDRAGDASISFGVTAVPLGIWIGVYALNSGTGVIRRIIEPRIFLTMFTQLAGDISQASKDRRFSVSKTAGLAQLSEQYVTFFQYSIPEIIEQVVELGGAVIALAAFDWRISLTCLTIILPLILINRAYNRNVVVLQKAMHDTFEDTYNVFSTQNPDEVRAYYQKSAGFRQKIASWGAANFGVMRFFLLIIFLVVLWIAIDMDEFTTGSIYAIVAYIWTFVTTSEYIPELMESWTSLKDISRRLKAATI